MTSELRHQGLAATMWLVFKEGLGDGRHIFLPIP